MSLAEACRLFGCSRQAYYQNQQRARQKQDLEGKVGQLVQQIRLRMPRLGTRKLYYLLQQQLQGLKVGRDKLFLEAVAVISESVGIYNNQRPHLSCQYLTPEQMHRQSKLPVKKWKKKTSNTEALEVPI